MKRMMLCLIMMLGAYGCKSGNSGEEGVTPDLSAEVHLSATSLDIYPNDVVHVRVDLVAEDGGTEDITALATWSLDSDIAVLNAPGVIRGVTQGDAIIIVTYDNQEYEIVVSVLALEQGLLSLLLEPAHENIPRGFALYAEALGVYNDGQTRTVTSIVEWQNETPQLIDIEQGPDNTRRVRGLNPGDAGITIAHGSLTAQGVYTITLSGLDEIEIVPSDTGLPVGATEDFTAIGRFRKDELVDITEMVQWSSTSQSVLQLSDEEGNKGHAVALDEGTVTVTASLDTDEGEVSGSTTIIVTPMHVEQLSTVPAVLSLPVGSTRRIRGSAVMEGAISLDITLVAQWQVEDESIGVLHVTPDNRLMFEAVSPGTTSMSLQFGDAELLLPVEVRDAELIDLEIFVVNSSIAAGDDSQYFAIGTYSDQVHADVSSLATWSSSEPDVAVIENFPEAGLALGLLPGESIITAEISGFEVSETLTVTDAVIQEIQLRPPLASVPIGDLVGYQALGLYSDNSLRVITDDVTWSNSDLEVAVISNAEQSKGELQTLIPGESVVTATLGEFQDTGELIVNDVQLQIVYISPSELTLLPGRYEELMVITMYDNGSTLISTDGAVFTSSDPNVVQVSNDDSTRGRVTAISVGEAEITANLNGMEGTRTVTVTAAELTGLQIIPDDVVVPVFVSEPLEAWGVFDEEGVEDEYTSWAVWTSSDESVVQVGNFPFGAGRVFGIAPGTATVTAGYGDFQASVDVSVDERQVVSIQIGPPNAILPVDFLQWFATIATFDDETTLDVTWDAPMMSSDVTIATILNNDFYSGIISTVGPGVATLSSSFAGYDVSTQITVRHSEPESLVVSPVNPTIADGLTRFLSATGMYPDNSSGDLTELCIWTSSDPFVVLVFDEMFVKGLIVALNPGTATITATCGDLVGETQVTVF